MRIPEMTTRQIIGSKDRLTQHPGIDVRFPGLEQGPGHARAAAHVTGFGSITRFVNAEERD